MSAPMKYQGYLQGEHGLYPVYTQEKVSVLPNMSYAYFNRYYMPQLSEIMSRHGFKGDGVNSSISNGKFTLSDMSPQNMGYDHKGNLRFIDVDVFKAGGRIRVFNNI